ncbi:MAG: DNA polymerase III subunit [Oscillospiraceae bacterium]|nr:DNA polymerase III subunit [Oscillospiraceae bacterium]
MGFEALLGNARLKENLSGSLRQGRISHFYLISGPEGSGKKTLARLLAAAMLCRAGEKPCGVCSHCRKALGNVHPDVIWVEDPEHKNVSVRIVREARESIFIRPNEGDRKVYIFSQEMGIEGQNALLKVLEEPPAYGAFLLLTDNPEKLLPTIRSRCTELNLHPLTPEQLRPALQKEFPTAAPDMLEAAVVRSGGYLGQAKKLLTEKGEISPQTVEFARVFTARDGVGLAKLMASMEKYKRDAFVQEIAAWSGLLRGALVCRSGQNGTTQAERELGAARSARELMNAYNQLQNAMQYAGGNVSVAALCGDLLWKLR